jgi:uncharacterized phiE125 gp8 family phage protein
MSWSAATLVTPPAAPAIALATLKEFVRVDGDDYDAQLEAFAAAAVDHIEMMCSIRLAPQGVELLADEWADLANLPIGPVTDIVSIHYADVAGAEQLLDAGSYELAGADLATGIRPSFGSTWPIARAIAGAIRVTLTVGYVDPPPAVLAAALYHASDIFAFRETAVVGTVAAKIPMSATVEGMLSNYRIWL